MICVIITAALLLEHAAAGRLITPTHYNKTVTDIPQNTSSASPSTSTLKCHTGWAHTLSRIGLMVLAGFAASFGFFFVFVPCVLCKYINKEIETASIENHGTELIVFGGLH